MHIVFLIHLHDDSIITLLSMCNYNIYLSNIFHIIHLLFQMYLFFLEKYENTFILCNCYDYRGND